MKKPLNYFCASILAKLLVRILQLSYKHCKLVPMKNPSLYFSLFAIVAILSSSCAVGSTPSPIDVKIEIIDAPSFSISNSNLIEITDSKMINSCPETNVLGEEGPEICKKEVTRITYFKKGDVTRFFACVGYSYDGAHFDAGQNGFVLAEYRNSKWTIIDFLQCHHDDGAWGNSFEIGNQFLLGKNSFAYNCSSCNGAQGNDWCEGFIVGFIDDKISILLQETSEENNQASGEEPVIDWHYDYKPISSDNQLFELERKYYKFDNLIGTKILKYNSQSMEFE